MSISVSHEGLVEGMRPFAGVKTSLQVQAQEKNGGPKKMNGRNLKDVTNKLEARPTISKASKVTVSGNGAHQAGGYRILKRSGLEE